MNEKYINHTCGLHPGKVGIHKELHFGFLSDVLNIDVGNLIDRCKKLYKESVRLYSMALREPNRNNLLISEDYILSVLKQEISPPIPPPLRFDFLIGKDDLLLSEISTLAAPLSFIKEIQLKNFAKKIRGFDLVIMLVLADEFGEAVGSESVTSYVEETSSRALCKFLDKNTVIRTVHYKEFLSEQFQSGDVGIIYWADPFLLDKSIKIVKEISLKVNSLSWKCILSLGHTLILNNKALPILASKLIVDSWIDQNFPQTWILENSFLNQAIQLRNNIVVKKKLSCDSRDIYYGSNYTLESWEALLKSFILEVDTNGYIAQRKVEPRIFQIFESYYRLIELMVYCSYNEAFDCTIILRTIGLDFNQGNNIKKGSQEYWKISDVFK